MTSMDSQLTPEIPLVAAKPMRLLPSMKPQFIVRLSRKRGGLFDSVLVMA